MENQNSNFSLIPDTTCLDLQDKLEAIVAAINRIDKMLEQRNKVSEYYDVATLAQRYKLSKAAIHKMVSRKELQPSFIGGKFLFKKEYIEQLEKTLLRKGVCND